MEGDRYAIMPDDHVNAFIQKGIRQSPGWSHYMIHCMNSIYQFLLYRTLVPEQHILLFRRNLE